MITAAVKINESCRITASSRTGIGLPEVFCPVVGTAWPSPDQYITHRAALWCLVMENRATEVCPVKMSQCFIAQLEPIVQLSAGVPVLAKLLRIQWDAITPQGRLQRSKMTLLHFSESFLFISKSLFHTWVFFPEQRSSGIDKSGT